MVAPHVSPELGKSAFNCPHCGAFSHFRWDYLARNLYGSFEYLNIQGAECQHCKRFSFWTSYPQTGYGEQIYPILSTAPLPNADMPEDCKSDYLEASTIVSNSPRGAAALLRLVIQKLCVHLGEPGKNINDDIGSLVKKGLPVEIQRALDIVRVTGNNAVHPGEMSIEDKPEIANSLFGLVNLIVQNRITQPKEIDGLFGTLPPKAIDAISKRDT